MDDYHLHSNYSDGRFLYQMLAAAEAAGVDGVGVADHCNVSDRAAPRLEKRLLGFTMDETYPRRRAAIEHLRETDAFDLAIYDAVEMDYHPDDAAAIAAFLDEAGFDYAVGSVHHLRERNLQDERAWADLDEPTCRAVVDEYYDALVALFDSELFAIAAHPDLIERNHHLRGYATEAHYRRVAEAAARSRTIPELNAGRVLDEYGRFHPVPAFLETLREAGVAVSVGTDAHAPEEIGPRVDAIEQYLEETGLTPATVPVG